MTVSNLHLPGALAPHLPGACVSRGAEAPTILYGRKVKRAMPFIPVPDVAQVRLEGRLDGQQTINDLYFRHTTGPIAAADLQGLASSIATWWVSNMVTLLNEAFSSVVVHARDLTAAIGFTADQGAPATGGTAGEAAPNNCTMAVSFRTSLSGRSNRGRNYIPCLTNSEVNGNNIDPTFATSIVDAYALLLFGGGSLPAGWVWVIVSRQSAGVPRVVGTFQEVFSVLVTDLVVDSQRRRLPGRGN